ncbi:hypothetical protein NEIFL0001_0376 [Neisseria flavescens SK114]|nr:hypothetical protein NEIFL0001_0376 [Neisseria flavescens SK114]
MPLKAEALRGRALRHIFSDGLIVATFLISQCNNMSKF